MTKVLLSPSRSHASQYGRKNGKQHPTCHSTSGPSARFASIAEKMPAVQQHQHPWIASAGMKSGGRGPRNDGRESCIPFTDAGATCICSICTGPRSVKRPQPTPSRCQILTRRVLLRDEAGSDAHRVARYGLNACNRTRTRGKTNGDEDIQALMLDPSYIDMRYL